MERRTNQIISSLLDIEDSKIAKACYKCTKPMVGLELSKEIGYFKLYSCDSGLLISYIYKENNLKVDEIYKKLIFGKINSNFGKIFESIVMQSLITNGFNPFYHTYEIEKDGKTSRYKIDFMIEKNGKVVAIEVKSGSNFTTSSLNNLKIKYPQLKFEKIIVSNKPLKQTDSVLYLPIYMISCINK